MEPVLGYRIMPMMDYEMIENQSKNWTENQMENQIKNWIENQGENQTEKIKLEIEWKIKILLKIKL